MTKEKITRETKVRAIVGKKNSGKSYYAFQIFSEKYLKRYPTRKVLYILPDLDESNNYLTNIKPLSLSDKNGSYYDWIGIRYINAQALENVFCLPKFIYKQIRECLIIFDDAHSTCFDNKLTKDLKHLLRRNRHPSLDIFFMVHTINEIPTAAFRYLDQLQLFQTVEPANDERQKKTRGITELENYVNQQTTHNPKNYFNRIYNISKDN